jgi:hypothetical protein
VVAAEVYNFFHAKIPYLFTGLMIVIRRFVSIGTVL